MNLHDPTRIQPRITLSSLFFAFFRMGLTAFGGPAMIPYIRKRVVEQKKWLDGGSFKDGVALCQAIPGATVMQMTAFIGLKIRGVSGAAVCFIGFVFPAFLLMMALSVVYARTHEIPAVGSIFNGLQAVIVAVLANAAWSFGKNTLKNLESGGVALISAFLLWLKANPILIILLAALLGMILNARKPLADSVSPSDRIQKTTGPFFCLMVCYLSCLTILFFFKKEFFDLSVLMSKIDLMAFGGGFASVPLMFHEIVEIRSWMDGPTFLNGIILGQFTPGPIVITATFVGYLVYGLAGAFVATIAIFFPSFLILVGIAPWFDRIRTSPWFKGTITGILCSFVGLLVTVTLRFAMDVHWDLAHTALAAASFAALYRNMDILWVILSGGVISALFF